MARKKVRFESAGTVWKLMVGEGDRVAEGDTLFILEVMKMEVPYAAPAAGAVATLRIAEGDVAEEDAVALEIEIE
ncbi:MAG: biotin/lipoyl-containing protein [Pseudomonadota bacterium]